MHCTKPISNFCMAYTEKVKAMCKLIGDCYYIRKNTVSKSVIQTHIPYVHMATIEVLRRLYAVQNEQSFTFCIRLATKFPLFLVLSGKPKTAGT